jgi:hypothetical protein
MRTTETAIYTVRHYAWEVGELTARDIRGEAATSNNPTHVQVTARSKRGKSATAADRGGVASPSWRHRPPSRSLKKKTPEAVWA